MLALMYAFLPLAECLMASLPQFARLFCLKHCPISIRICGVPPEASLSVRTLVVMHRMPIVSVTHSPFVFVESTIVHPALWSCGLSHWLFAPSNFTNDHAASSNCMAKYAHSAIDMLLLNMRWGLRVHC